MEHEIKFEELIQVYLAKWPILILSFVLAAILAFSYSKFCITPLYSSIGTLYVTSENPAAVEKNIKETVNLSDLMLAQELAKSYEAILSSNTFLKRVAEESDLGFDYKALGKMINISKLSDTEIMMINVTYSDPVIAQRIANVVLENAPMEIERIIYGGQARVIDPAELPVSPSSPNIKSNTLIGAFIGLAIAVIMIFAFYFFDNKIKSAEDLVAVIDVPLLGIVPEIIE